MRITNEAKEVALNIAKSGSWGNGIGIERIDERSIFPLSIIFRNITTDREVWFDKDTLGAHLRYVFYVDRGWIKFRSESDYSGKWRG